MASSGCVLERKATQLGDVWLHRSAPPLVNSAQRCWCKFKREANFYALDGKKCRQFWRVSLSSLGSWYVYTVGMKDPTSVFTFLHCRVPPNPQLGLIYIQAPLPQNYSSRGFQLLLCEDFDLLVQKALWWVVIGEGELEALYFHSFFPLLQP